MPTLIKRGQTWHYRVYCDGRDKWKTTRTGDRAKALQIAKEGADQLRGRIGVDELFDRLTIQIGRLPPKVKAEVSTRYARRLLALESATLPIAGAWETWLTSPNKGAPAAATVASYSHNWHRFERWAREQRIENMHEVTRTHVDAYTRDLFKDKLAGRTYNGHVVFLRGVFKALATAAGLAENPWADVRRLPLRTEHRENFSMEELAAICAKATGEWRIAIALALFTGLRLGDVVNLRWDTIKPGRIEIVPSKTARTGKRITIPLHPTLAGLLTQHRQTVAGEYVLPQLRAQHTDYPSGVSRAFRELVESCGIVSVEQPAPGRTRVIVRRSFHSLRHSFVSLCAASGVPQHVVQGLVGHGSPAMTEVYTHTSFDQKQAAIAALPAIAFDSKEGAA